MKNPVTGDKPHQCDDCGRRLSDDELEPIRKESMRTEPGGTVPSGQCPDCGALAFLKAKKSGGDV